MRIINLLNNHLLFSHKGNTWLPKSAQSKQVGNRSFLLTATESTNHAFKTGLGLMMLGIVILIPVNCNLCACLLSTPSETYSWRLTCLMLTAPFFEWRKVQQQVACIIIASFSTSTYRPTGHGRTNSRVHGEELPPSQVSFCSIRGCMK